MPEEFVIPLAIDLTNILNRVQPVTAGLNTINQAATTATSNMRSGFNAAATAADATGRRIAGTTSLLNTQSQSIEGLRIRMQQYKAMADLATDPKKLVEYNKKVQEISDSINKLQNAGKKGFDDLGNRIEDSGKKVSNLQSIFKSLIGFITVAFAVRAIINFGKEVVNVSNQLEGVERAFNRINAPGLLDQLRKATRGTVSDLDLMKKAVLANQFDIPIKQLASFYEFASKRARDLGVDSAKFVNDVIAGTARGSVRILDNLGISQAEVRAEFKRTGDFAAAVFNIVEKQLAKTKAELDTNGDRFARISATITNIEGNLGKSSSGIISTITSLVQKQLDLIDDYIIGLDGKLEALGQKFATQDNTKLIAAFKDDSAEGRASALKGYDALIAKQEQVVANANKKISDTANDLNLIQRIGRAAFTDLNDSLENQRNSSLVYLSELKGEKQSLLGVVDQEVQAQKKAEEQAAANADKIAARNAKIIAERKRLNDQLTKLTNDFYTAQIDAIEDQTTKEVARETVSSQNKIRSLENDRSDLRQRAKEFPELANQYKAVIKQVNADILQEQSESVARVLLIIKKGEEEQIKLRQQSVKEIASVLKRDSEAQIIAINERYDKIRAEAKKAGILTAQVEKQLAVQQAKDVNNATIKEIDDNLQKQEQIVLSALYARKKKEGESEKKFERDNQISVLQVQIEFAMLRRKLISSDPDKVKEVNDLTTAINKMQKALKGLKDEGTKDLFSTLGLNEDTITKYGKAISTIGQQFSDFFGALITAADGRINAIRDQISAVDDLINADQNAVDKQQDLADRGRANNLTAAKKRLDDDKKVKAQLQKQEEEAQKKKEALQKAQIIADSLAQVSNLITASTEIFESLSGIPFIGVPLALSLIGLMFGGFAAAKVTAFNSTKQTAAEGATVGGRLHSEGGNKYVSMDGNDRNVLEIERGEEIVRRSSSAKHRRLIKAINSDDFSKINIDDISIKQLLSQTGVLSHIDVAKKTGDYNTRLQDSASKIILINPGANSSDKILNSINQNIQKLASSNRQVFDMGDYIWIIEGNYSYKTYKH